MSNDELLKVSEVAKMLRISRDSVLGLIERGELRALRLGPKTIRIFKTSVSQYIAASEI